MERVARLSDEQAEELGLRRLGGALLRVTKLDGMTEIARVPTISLQDLARFTNTDDDLANEDH